MREHLVVVALQQRKRHHERVRRLERQQVRLTMELMEVERRLASEYRIAEAALDWLDDNFDGFGTQPAETIPELNRKRGSTSLLAFVA